MRLIHNLKIITPGNRKLFWLLGVSLLLLFTLGAASCASTQPDELTKAKKLWDSQKLDNYDFTLQRSCFCPEDWRGPVNIQVRNGEAVSVVYVSNGETATSEKFDVADTIDKLFTILEDAYAGTGDFDQKADSIDVEYDADMGYPTNFYIDISKQMADEETGYTVTNLQAQ